MFEGLKTAPAVSTAAVFTLTPIMAGLFGWLVLRQVTTPRMMLALAIGGTGALWVIFRADLAALLAFDIGRGEVIYFVGCIAHALYAPMVPKLNRGEPTVVFTFGTLAAGTLCLAIVGGSAVLATPWASLSPFVWFVIAYLAVVASSATFVLLQFASMRLKAAKVMAYTYLTPSWVILWEIALGNGAPPAAVLVGIGLTVAALLLLLKTEP
jgi:drug/metabolite transporter (DMT)-like permease